MVLGVCLQFVVADKYYIGGFEDGQIKGRRYFRNDLLSGFNTDYPPDAPTAKSPTDRLGDKLKSPDTTTNTILQDTKYGKVSAIILQMFIIGITIADSALTGGFSIASPLGTVMSAALGGLPIFESFRDKSGDIVQAAFDLLTQEVDVKIEDMRRYTDTAVLSVEKGRMDENFRELSNLYRNCDDDVLTPEASDRVSCMTGLLSSTESKFDTFARYNKRIGNDQQREKMSNQEACEVSDTIMVFQTYVALANDIYRERIVQAQDAAKSASKDQQKKFEYVDKLITKWKGFLKRASSYSHDALWFVKGKNEITNGEYCFDNIKCQDADVKTKGLVSLVPCTCPISPMLAKRICTIKLPVTKKDKKIMNEGIQVDAVDKNDAVAKKKAAYKYFSQKKDHAKTYISQFKLFGRDMGESVQRYWSRNMSRLLRALEAVAKEVEEDAAKMKKLKEDVYKNIA